MKRDNLISKGISYLFHPLLLPTFGLFLIFNLNGAGLWIPSHEIRMALYAITFAVTFLLPLLNVFFLLKIKYISSLEMVTKEERKIPYLVTATMYFAESYFLIRWDVPSLIKALMLGATLLVVSVLIINLFWKISAHTVGIGGLCGMMIAISYRLQINILLLLIILFIVAGLVAAARLKLNAHNPSQVYVGFLLGIILQLILFL